MTTFYPNRCRPTLQGGPDTVWAPAQDTNRELCGSEVAETTYRFADRDLRLIVRRQRKVAGEQLSFDDLRGWRFFTIVSNVEPTMSNATDIDRHHRLRGGAPEEAIPQLKEDFGTNHAPRQSFSARKGTGGGG